MISCDIELDVSEAVGLREARIAASVMFPDPESLRTRPIVCIAKPGAGYSKEYFSLDLPGPGSGAQASWFAERGWIFVSVDHLGAGGSSRHDETSASDYRHLSLAGHAAESDTLRQLRAGTLNDGIPPIIDPIVVGIGQSMGGCITIVQQAHYATYDGVAILGYSAIHTSRPAAPGSPAYVRPWIPRDVQPQSGLLPQESNSFGMANRPQVATAEESGDNLAAISTMRWGFHYDDVNPSVDDISDWPGRNGSPPPWATTSIPEITGTWCVAPGAVAPEAAAISVPVLIAFGERDACPDPRGEMRAYQSCSSLDLFICPRMGHMHNFASTRQLLWRRIYAWGEWVRMHSGDD